MTSTEPFPPRTSRETKFIINLLWTSLIIVGYNVIVFIGYFLNPPLYDFWYALAVALGLTIPAIILTIVGTKMQRKKKVAEEEASTLYRKLFNVAGGVVMAIICWIFGPWIVFFVMIGLLYAYGLHEIVLCKLDTPIWFSDALAALGRQAKEKEVFWQPISALVSFVIIIFIPSLLFQFLGTPQFWAPVVIIFIISTIVWGIGDSLAYYVGTRYGNHKIPWNKQKSVEGSLAMAIIGILIALIFLSAPIFNLFGLTTPLVTGGWYVILAILAGFFGAFIESLKLPLDDNFTTPTFTAVFLSVVLFLLSYSF
ncbi:MAG: hypothetical protein HWN66_08115 [Candidatus Helarchaeota archaeon]|nr:hypothetical protein [Candidatus Helarchaeota archaeon]